MSNPRKFHFKCPQCQQDIGGFKEWFANGQQSPCCREKLIDVVYLDGYEELGKLVKNKRFRPESLWDYFDYLPLIDQSNIVSTGTEGVVPIQTWSFLEEFAKKNYGISIKVYAHRHDRNFATGTFKDLAGTMVASVLRENGVKNYVSASTGNIGVAYSRYLAQAEISLTVFIPKTTLLIQESDISSFGQAVVRVDGDYHKAKEVAANFAKKHDFLLTGGNFDPMRLEAKKTMVYEWLRLLPEFPTVFMQAVSGGSGPLGVAKACKELEGQGLFKAMPRFILPQPHRCAPMAEAWDAAVANNFPEGWETKYPVWVDPQTTVHTLATGNPTAYPPLAKLVRESQGRIMAVEEDRTIDVARLVAYETSLRLGPASAVTLVGFFQALKDGDIKNGDVVMLNIGEGAGRAPQFMEQLVYATQFVKSVDECEVRDRSYNKGMLWEAVGAI